MYPIRYSCFSPLFTGKSLPSKHGKHLTPRLFFQTQTQTLNSKSKRKPTNKKSIYCLNSSIHLLVLLYVLPSSFPSSLTHITHSSHSPVFSHHTLFHTTTHDTTKRNRKEESKPSLRLEYNCPPLSSNQEKKREVKHGKREIIFVHLIRVCLSLCFEATPSSISIPPLIQLLFSSYSDSDQELVSRLNTKPK